MLLVAALYAGVGLFALLKSAPTRAGLAVALGGMLALLGLASLRTWQIVPAIVPTGYRLLALDEGEGATITVMEDTSYRERFLTVNSR